MAWSLSDLRKVLTFCSAGITCSRMMWVLWVYKTDLGKAGLFYEVCISVWPKWRPISYLVCSWFLTLFHWRKPHLRACTSTIIYVYVQNVGGDKNLILGCICVSSTLVYWMKEVIWTKKIWVWFYPTGFFLLLFCHLFFKWEENF